MRSENIYDIFGDSCHCKNLKIECFGESQLKKVRLDSSGWVAQISDEWFLARGDTDLYKGLVIGNDHIIKIEDCHTNIDRWSIIGDYYLLNVFTDCNYSNSVISRVCLTKVKGWIKLYHITETTIIFICSTWSLVILRYTDRNITNFRKRVCWNISDK